MRLLKFAANLVKKMIFLSDSPFEQEIKRTCEQTPRFGAKF